MCRPTCQSDRLKETGTERSVVVPWLSRTPDDLTTTLHGTEQREGHNAVEDHDAGTDRPCQRDHSAQEAGDDGEEAETREEHHEQQFVAGHVGEG